MASCETRIYLLDVEERLSAMRRLLNGTVLDQPFWGRLLEEIESAEASLRKAY